MTRTGTDYKTMARQFIGECKHHGFTFIVMGRVIRVSKRFAPGDTEAYTSCDANGPYLLQFVPQTGPGSVWGTDGGSVGGYVGLKNGEYVLNKSGVSARFIQALEKLSI